MRRLLASLLATVTLPNVASAATEVGSQTSFGSLGDVVSKIFDVLLVFLPTVAALYLIISGYRYTVAQGNPDLVERAKKSLLYAVFGLVVALVAVLLILLVSDALGFNSGLRP